MSVFVRLFCLGLFCLGIFHYSGLFCPGLLCLFTVMFNGYNSQLCFNRTTSSKNHEILEPRVDEKNIDLCNLKAGTRFKDSNRLLKTLCPRNCLFVEFFVQKSFNIQMNFFQHYVILNPNIYLEIC